MEGDDDRCIYYLKGDSGNKCVLQETHAWKDYIFRYFFFHRITAN